MNLRRYVTLTDEKARHVIAVAALIAAGLLAAGAIYAWGQAAVNAIFGLGWAWLFWELTGVAETSESASDEADLARGKIDAVEAHLSGLETPGSGRHSRRAA